MSSFDRLQEPRAADRGAASSQEPALNGKQEKSSPSSLVAEEFKLIAAKQGRTSKWRGIVTGNCWHRLDAFHSWIKVLQEPEAIKDHTARVNHGGFYWDFSRLSREQAHSVLL